MERMVTTIGNELFLVSRAQGDARDVVLRDLEEKIKKHKEKELLQALLKNAIAGRTEVFLGKTLPPVELEEEGIEFEGRAGNVFARFGSSKIK